MLYLFYGKDSFRLKKRVEEVVEGWKEKYGDDGVTYLDGKNLDIPTLRSEILSLSIFSPKRLIIINSISGNAKAKEYILDNEEIFVNSENLILFLEEDLKSGKSDSFSAFIKKKGHVENFLFLEGDDLKNWIILEASRYGVSIKGGAVGELEKSSRGDLFGLENEIRKLANYVLAEERKEITLADIDKLIERKEDANVFAITDAIGARNRRLSFILIDSHIKGGGVILVLFATIATHIKNLMIVKESPAASPGELGMNPYVKMKCSGQAKNFTIEELKKLFTLLIDLDKKIKVGQIGQQEAVETFILAL